MLKKRVITALCGTFVVLLAAWNNEPLPWFTVFAVVWGMLAALEFYRITAVSRVPVLAGFGTVWTVLFVISPHFNFPFLIPALLAGAVVISLMALVFLPQKDDIFATWAWTIAGVLYVGWLGSYLVRLLLEAGINWFLLALLAIFACDSAAFFTGGALGRHRLAPRISPHKTWEGALAGLLASVVFCLLFTLPSPLAVPLGGGQAVLLGLLVGTIGQLGDLVESLLKRNRGIKESGNLLPGHGGLLDRMDSVVFVAVVVYYFWLAGQLLAAPW